MVYDVKTNGVPKQAYSKYYGAQDSDNSIKKISISRFFFFFYIPKFHLLWQLVCQHGVCSSAYM